MVAEGRVGGLARLRCWWIGIVFGARVDDCVFALIAVSSVEVAQIYLTDATSLSPNVEEGVCAYLICEDV